MPPLTIDRNGKSATTEDWRNSRAPAEERKDGYWTPCLTISAMSYTDL